VRRSMLYMLGMIVLCLVGALPAAAQTTGGQFCVRAFEDTNADGIWQRELNEGLLTRDLAISLLDAQGVAVASGLLAESPTAEQGVLCFTLLPAGQYTAVMTSPDLTATTPNTVTAAVNANGEPVIVEYGAQRAALLPNPVSATPVLPQNDLLRWAISGAGAFAVMIGMVILGLLIYMFGLRRGAQAPPNPKTTTGTMRAVNMDDTGKMPRVK
jgi:hypothetical protein